MSTENERSEQIDDRLASPGTNSQPDSAAILASYLAPDGSLRLPGLAIVDEQDRDLITARVRNGRAELKVRLPMTGGGATEVTMYADNGPKDYPDVEPSVGFEIAVDGNQAVVVDVVPDLRGGWKVIRSTPPPPTSA